jgi:hypothetical protein
MGEIIPGFPAGYGRGKNRGIFFFVFLNFFPSYFYSSLLSFYSYFPALVIELFAQNTFYYTNEKRLFLALSFK